VTIREVLGSLGFAVAGAGFSLLWSSPWWAGGLLVFFGLLVVGTTHFTARLALTGKDE
jgi:uncharacterized membrane protein YjjP (DUF1212 family)